MDRCWQHLLLLWMIAAVAINIQGNNAEAVETDKLQVKNITSLVEVIPPDSRPASVNKLVIQKNKITLTEQDKHALASYEKLVELHLDENLVTTLTANCFSLVPHLRVLTLSQNQIYSLDPKSFFGLEDLTELDLSKNMLTSLPPHLFKEQKHLKVLNLQGNPWNCSCSLLRSIDEIRATGVTFVGQNTTCLYPKEQHGEDLLEATAKCPPPPSPPPSSTAEPKTPVKFQQSKVPITLPKTMMTTNTTKKDQTPVISNAWKFTACVAVSAMCICMLIVGAFKGPSWYKLFHNYRHQRLRQEEDGREDRRGDSRKKDVSTVFSETGGYMTHQTFTFKQDDGQVEVEEEEEDGYFEDPYIKRED